MSAEALFEALDDAIALAHEFDGAGIDEKLAPFGLRAADLQAVLLDRWEAYRDRDEEPHMVFVRAFTEGLLTGVQVSRR